jgi:Fe-S cluster biosynthesis and repair protein YggX
MSQLQDRIAQFRKMAHDDPDNELGHYRLGQLLAEGGQHEDAIASYRRTLELSPQFSKVYQLLAQSLIDLGRPDEAIGVLQEGYRVADERGDRMPRDAMGQMLVQLGQPAPKPAAAQTVGLGLAGSGAVGVGGFRCQRTMCMAGPHARQLEQPPFNDEIGKKIYERVCAQCWNDWLKNYSVKVINELRLDLSTERGQEEYDRYMREFLGLD